MAKKITVTSTQNEGANANFIEIKDAKENIIYELDLNENTKESEYDVLKDFLTSNKVTHVIVDEIELKLTLNDYIEYHKILLQLNKIIDVDDNKAQELQNKLEEIANKY
jgi:hypothetical protein